MPNAHSTLTGLFTDIADAIRAQTGSEADIVADDFPTAIAAIRPSLSAAQKCNPAKATATGSGTSKTVTCTYTFDKVPGAKYYILIGQRLKNSSTGSSYPSDYTQEIALFDGTNILYSSNNSIVYVGSANDQFTFTNTITYTGSVNYYARSSLYGYAIL